MVFILRSYRYCWLYMFQMKGNGNDTQGDFFSRFVRSDLHHIFKWVTEIRIKFPTLQLQVRSINVTPRLLNMFLPVTYYYFPSKWCNIYIVFQSIYSELKEINLKEIQFLKPNDNQYIYKVYRSLSINILFGVFVVLNSTSIRVKYNWLAFVLSSLI